MQRRARGYWIAGLIGGFTSYAVAQNTPQATPAVASTFVTSFNTIGGESLPPGLLDKYLSSHTMQKKTLVELRKLAAQLEKQLQTEHGLPSAKVWVPLQEDKLGVIDIRVLPGQIREVRLASPATHARQTRALALLTEQFKPGALLDQKALESTSILLTKLLGETPRLSLAPASTIGQYDLILEPVEVEKYSLSASVDNLGNPYINQARDKTQLQVRNALFDADLLTLSGQLLTQNQKTALLRYDTPLGLSNFKLGVTNISTRYQLVGTYTSLQAKGDTHITGTDLTHQFVRSAGSGLNLSWRAEALSRLSRSSQADVVTTDRRVHAFNFGLYGDAPAWGGTRSVNLVLTKGHADLGHVATDLSNDIANIQGYYQKMTVRVEQSIAWGTAQRAQINFSVQRARKNLDSTEAMLVGGMSGVRAYPIGEAAADSGAVLNLEMHHRWNEQWRGFVFYDHGWASLRQLPVAGSTKANNYDINGAGFSIVWSPTNGTEMAIVPAWKLKANAGADTTTGADSDGRSSKARLWVFATHQF
jgi:hemolysin activation/secretion protein